MHKARPQILSLWEEGDRFLDKRGTTCPEEIHFSRHVGRSYYQCQPHLWECYWRGGVLAEPSLKVDFQGQSYHVKARAAFPQISEFNQGPRHIEFWRKSASGQELPHGWLVEMEIEGIEGFSQRMVLTDTCRDSYLPQRAYSASMAGKDRRDGFIWDNFGRHLFIDRFYVTNQKVNEWRLATKQKNLLQLDRQTWHRPALLSINDQRSYCAFYGKRLMEAKLFDAATMPPGDPSNLIPEKIFRPQTPWHRDIGKTFLGTARVNPDFQLTPLDCQLAQVHGCEEKFFATDSATWMGIYFALGFYPEAFVNSLEPKQNLKLSSKLLPARSEWHELGLRSNWSGEQDAQLPVAFRCYEEAI
jgi:hypothetical protein